MKKQNKKALEEDFWLMSTEITEKSEGKKTEKKVIEERIALPEGMNVSLENYTVKIKGKNKELARKFFYPGVEVSVKNNEVAVKSKNAVRKNKAVAGTFAAHIRNMIQGIAQGFEYRLKIVYSHFPITVKKEGDSIVITNFLGEKHPRRTVISKDVQFEVKGDIITLKGADVEHLGQSAANLEKATVVRKRDRRVFQDGIYIVQKPK